MPTLVDQKVGTMSGESFGAQSIKIPMFPSPNQFHVDIFWFFLSYSKCIRGIFYRFLCKLISNFLAVLNFNRLFLKLNPFIEWEGYKSWVSTKKLLTNHRRHSISFCLYRLFQIPSVAHTDFGENKQHELR